MTRRLYRFAVLAAAILTAGVSSAAEDDILYWMVEDNATVNRWWGEYAGTYNISDYFNDSRFYPGGSDFAARIRVTGGDITGDTFLDLYYSDGSTEPGEFGVDFGESGGYWGAGVPTGNQSPSGDYSAGTPEYAFIVELGNVVYDEVNDSLSWTTVASSASMAYSDLTDYIHAKGSIDPPRAGIWTPVYFTAVPEPSCGLLTLLGLAALALRRKRLVKGD